MENPVLDELKGPIAWMARNAVAANLLMVILLVGGALGVMRATQQLFPEFDLDIVAVTIPFPGATPTEVEQGVVLVAEEALSGLSGVKSLQTTAKEGVASVLLELEADADADRVLADAKAAIDRIRTFPAEAEKPVVELVFMRQEVVSLVISGDKPRALLQRVAEEVRQELLEHPDISQTQVLGLPSLEMSIEVRRQQLESLGLTLEEVARQIRAASLEMGGGVLESPTGEILVRLADRRHKVPEFEDLIVRGTTSGARVRLGEIATIRDGYSDTDKALFFNGKRAVEVRVLRMGDETPVAGATAAREIQASFDDRLPPGVSIDSWADRSVMLEGRIDLLVRNARMGLLMVVGVLALFLNLRLAFWVSLGIPISFLGSFVFLGSAGQTINMLSLFAFIVTLGMVVDDAIVVGEAAYARMQRGEDRLRAAILGAREVVVPVTFAILTTIAAFAPLLVVPGVMGKFFRVIPAVVILVLLLSLVESFFILPAHLAHIGLSKTTGVIARIEKLQGRVARWLEHFVKQSYEPFLRRTIRDRYFTISLAVAMLCLTIGLVGGGIVPFSFFPQITGDQVQATVTMPYGTPIERTDEVRVALEEAAWVALEGLDGADAVVGQLTRLGQGPEGRGGFRAAGSHLVVVEFELRESDERSFTVPQFQEEWRLALPEQVGVRSLRFSSNFGPGMDSGVSLQLSHPNMDTLSHASEDLETELHKFEELVNIENAWSAGKRQLDFHMLESARDLGLTGHALASQLRSALFGAEALREQRGRHEVKVMVRLPEEQRRSEHDLSLLRLRTPSGGFVPLQQVANFERGRAPTEIRREHGRRVVTVSAKLAQGAQSPGEVIAALKNDVLPAFRERHTGIDIGFVGEQQEQAETFESLGSNFLLALFVIFAMLAVPMKSYTQPLVVMSAIPFGLVGAVFGHLVMGYGMSIISMFGLIALSGVVVNDSLVLVDAVNRVRRTGVTAVEAVVTGASRRFRPILLTSLTTFFGLLPMMFETSMQARFLIPMALSLGFGVLFVTVIALLIVPAFYVVLEDLHELVARLRGTTA